MKIRELVKESKLHFGIVYKLTNTINNKIYIGQTTNLINRLNQYRNNNPLNDKKSKYEMMYEVYKYGFNVFDLEIVDTANSKEELWEKERLWISQLNATNPLIGYNKKTGGAGGILNPESREKMSISSRSFRHSEEEKQRRSKRIITFKDNIVKTHKSAKAFSDILGLDRSIVSRSIKNGTRLDGHYIYYADYNERLRLIQKYESFQHKLAYIRIAKSMGNRETIEGYLVVSG
jgi:predicted GIY-YIG superfamily endonuclease